MPHSRQPGWPVASLAVLVLLGIVALAYWPGLSGGFLFDDLINLDALGRYGGVRNLDTLLYFLTSGTADPTGRPVAQLSFLVDATDWPADPWPFKRTNLAIHLANGALLVVLLRRLQRWLPRSETSNVAAFVPLLAGCLWLAHPLWVSTTLYVIQRQAMLAATFTLLGLLAWDSAYRRLLAGQRVRGWAWIALGVGGATLLAGLSKANGFQLPLLALALWAVLQAPGEAGLLPARQRSLRGQVALGIGVPAAVFLGYLLYQVPAAIRSAAAMRDWTLGERLLSEPRALWEYLGLLVAPRSGGGGVFTDAFVASRGVLEPWTTLPAIAGLAGLAVLAIAGRRRWPRLSAAIAFFLAAHLVESGPVSLELYFEHRNYLPAMLLGWPVAHALLAPGPAQRLRLGLAVALPLLWLALTWQRALVWGNPPLQAALWAERNPDSPRAQAHAATWLRAQGRHDEARALLARAQARMPGESLIALNRIAQGCANDAIGEADVVAAVQATRRIGAWNQATVDWYANMQRAVLHGDCRALRYDGWIRIAEALGANPSFVRAPARRQALSRMAGRRALAQGDPAAALDAFDRGLSFDPRPELALAQAADLGNAGYPAWGVRHLDRFRALDVEPEARVRDMRGVHRWLLQRTGYYQDELDALRQALARDAG